MKNMFVVVLMLLVSLFSAFGNTAAAEDSGVWLLAADMPHAGDDGNAVLLPDGRVFFVWTNDPAQTAVIYDPRSNSWCETSPMPHPQG